ncbi:hypothetical protein [Paraflavitalea sp. CAU 1676]|uniref:M949_RS01915 family surface polysaccharide biosynthesis protein n=1 Tax=Paraflavitalea sp. CAU 1676 TaxID=3032598 RepID=UPI0023DA7DEA|nr:hypothetical protein [Paraflavitalea sp. CAU 1676]MDF2187984.1 hypothetical protein [Paraflavitalea sp. CAU 1676]
MKKCFYLLASMVFLVASSGFAQLTTTKVPINQLPKDIKYSGKVKEAIKFSDKAGEQLVIITETGEYVDKKLKHENDGRDAEVYAYLFQLTGGTVKQSWRIYDFIHDCEVDLAASFVKNTLQVTDLDKNGIAEVWVMYTTVCHGDVSPMEMKVIMYQGAQKYAMRGETRVKASETETYGGDYKFDPAFVKAPKVIRDFAMKLWKEHVDE